MAKGKMFKLANGDPVEVISSYNDRIVVLYNGIRLDRPADLIGRVPVSYTHLTLPTKA